MSKRVNILGVIAAFVVAIVRHGVQYKWGPWESWSLIPISWFIHWIALMLLIVVSAAAISRWHKYFLGTEAPESHIQFQYYVTMTVLAASIAIAMLSVWPESED